MRSGMKQLCAVALFAAASLSPLAAADGAMVGYISDMKCATSGQKVKTAAEWIKPAAFESCVKDCVKEGSEAVFLTEDNKILHFDAASREKITPFLGNKVSVTATVTGTTIKIDKISALKLVP